jgi:hypothetical protein
MAAADLRELLFAVVVTVHVNIRGLSCAFGRKRRAVGHLEAL